jgi:8-amino-7-oxononanoate synthase
MSNAPSFVSERLSLIHERGLHRSPPILETSDGVRGRVDGREALLFCSNDYLGLRLDPRVREAAAEGADRYGGGTGSSRLIAGTLPIHRELEEALARWLGTEATLLCSSGFQANISLLQGLAGVDDMLFSDSLNHASIIDGCRLSRASHKVIRHGDRDFLSRALALAPGGQRFVIGEGLYSMDGERGDIAGWVAARDAAGAGTTHVLVDEAHAIGVLGEKGRGAASEMGLDGALLARVGTLGKALGAHGAFIASDASTIDLLRNTSAYIFTTGLAPAPAAAGLRALQIVSSDEGQELRGSLARLSNRFRDGAQAQGFELAGDPGVPIVPLILGGAARAMSFFSRLLDEGIFAMAIRPPTVRRGSCRIRITLSAAHKEEDVDAALGALARVAAVLGPGSQPDAESEAGTGSP